MQLSLLDQARLRRPGASEPDLVRDIADELVAELEERPPISLSVVAGYRGVDRIEVADLPVAGSLSREDGGFIIRLRRGDRRQRQRFTGFHEIGHTFQPGYALKTQTRCPAPSAYPRKRLNLEGLCDLSAAELILPERFFAPDVHQGSFDLDCLAALAGRYDASLEATGYRFVRFWPEEALFLVLEPGLRKAERDDPPAQPKLRIRRRLALGNWPFLPINKSVAPEGAFARAEREEINEMTFLSDVGVASDLGIRVAARAFPYRDAAGKLHQRVLAICRKSAGLGRIPRTLAA